MADDASSKFHVSPDIFLSLFYTTYSPQQSPGMWHAFHPPSKIVSLVISALRKQPFKVFVSPLKRLPRSIVTGCPSAPKCIWTKCLKTCRTPLSISCRCLVTGSVTDTTPHGCTVFGRTRLLWHGVLSPRPTSLRAAGTLGIRLGPTVGTSKNASPTCSATMGSRNPPPTA